MEIFSTGNLRFTNVLPGDGRGGSKYVCVVHNQVMMRTQQGEYSIIHPQGGTQTDADRRRCSHRNLYTHTQTSCKIAKILERFKFQASPLPRWHVQDKAMKKLQYKRVMKPMMFFMDSIPWRSRWMLKFSSSIFQASYCSVVKFCLFCSQSFRTLLHRFPKLNWKTKNSSLLTLWTFCFRHCEDGETGTHVGHAYPCPRPQRKRSQIQMHFLREVSGQSII